MEIIKVPFSILTVDSVRKPVYSCLCLALVLQIIDFQNWDEKNRFTIHDETV